MDKKMLLEKLLASGREPRKCAEYERAKKDAASGHVRTDWPVKNSIGHMRYQLGLLEA